MLKLNIGDKYNWRGQFDQWVYLGNNWSSNGYWHQFALVDTPDVVWCECLNSDLDNIEETNIEVRV